MTDKGKKGYSEGNITRESKTKVRQNEGKVKTRSEKDASREKTEE